MSSRKLAELWEIDGDYHIRVEVGSFQRGLGATDPAHAAETAEFEMVEVLRKIVSEYDAGAIQVTDGSEFPP